MNRSGVRQTIDNMITAHVCLPGACCEDAMEKGLGASQGTMDEESDGSLETCSSTSRWL